LDEQLQQYRLKKRDDVVVRARYHETLREVVRSLEEVIDAALKVYDAIGATSAKVLALPEAQRMTFADHIAAHLRELFEESKDDLHELSLLERRGYRVARAEEFKWAMHEAQTIGNESRRLLDSIATAESGRVTSLAEAMNELRRRPDARGAGGFGPAAAAGSEPR